MLRDLRQAEWPRRAGLAALTAALGAENIRWVGGAVRDSLLGAQVHDVDCATLLLPAEVIDRCRAAGIRTVPTGIEHGTVTAILKDGPVEITTLRRDVETDGRRATIAFAKDWPEDAARRDFTINALYAHPETLEIADFFGGLDDLRERRVRFIGSAEQRIAEDHLRILRYYRFQARFGAALDAEAESACAALAHTLKGLSRERIAAELLALLALPDPHATLERMRANGMLGVILPEACAAQLAALGPVTRGATRLWRIGILSHLRTDLRVTPARRPDFAALVRRLHPTPAVGTSPREAWREWIPRIDHEVRGTFAAPFGLALPDETSRCLVAIRQVQWERGQTRCGAGCGLVRGSSLARELSELRLKLAATRGNLGL